MIRIFVRACSSSSHTVRPPIPVFGIEGRYVSALYSAAVQKKEIDEVEKHMRSLQTVIRKPIVIDFIDTCLLSRVAKAKFLGNVAKEAGMPSTAVNFLSIVAENGRLKLLRRMLNTFETVMVAHHKEALCEVITATKLDENNRKTLMDTLTKFVKGGQKIRLTEKVDPSIIGGMIVGIEDKHIDLSISKKIQLYTDILKQSI